ncbi:MAG TPA: hypothetical protein DEB10_09355 [Ruminococcaceae bacterium]|jgi:hypothetical protein|nr:hypothetical protein [Oscillospiraceae bacterium]HCA28616.1 hypothetical protein [Oscillospiraceae bacterium]
MPGGEEVGVYFPFFCIRFRMQIHIPAIFICGCEEGMGEMGEYILLVMVLLLSLYGCVELVRSITLRFLQSDHSVPTILVLPISGSCRNVEYIVRAAVSRSRWTSDSPGQVLLLDNGMDEQTRVLAEKISQDFENVLLTTPRECEKVFVSGLQ